MYRYMGALQGEGVGGMGTSQGGGVDGEKCCGIVGPSNGSAMGVPPWPGGDLRWR